MSRRLADPQIVGSLRELLDSEAVGMGRALPLSLVARRLGCHSRRVTEALSFLQAQRGEHGSIAGVGLFRIANEEERRRAIRPEASRLRKIAAKLEGLGWRDKARDLRQLALSLDLPEQTA
jgi:hypothetical protein